MTTLMQGRVCNQNAKSKSSNGQSVYKIWSLYL